MGTCCSSSSSLRRHRECGGFDFTCALELQPPAIHSGLGESSEKRDLAFTVLRVALIRMAMDEGRGILVDEYEMRNRTQPGLKVLDRRPGLFILSGEGERV